MSDDAKGRKCFKHQGTVIYEWEESLDSILVFIQPPPLPENIKIKAVIQIKFNPKSLSVGIKGNPPYLAHQTAGIVDCDESLWYLNDSEKDKNKRQIVIEIQKAQKGMQWGCVFKGHSCLNPLEEEELKKKMMLERFQEENPGFDFSGADFNGKVPDARTFMGGVKYQ